MLEKGSAGTLADDNLIRVWIDVPNPKRAVIEVRRVDGSFARRALTIGKFPSDVAAEAVALAASEMVRVQQKQVDKPAPAPPPAAPKTETVPTSFAVGGALHATFAPVSTPGVFFGPELGIDLRHGGFGHRLYGRWLAALGDERARWLEIGAGADYRLRFHDRWRVHFGARAAVVDLAFGDAVRVAGEPSSHDWTIRLGGVLGIEGQLTRGTWAMLGVEPGAALRPLNAQLSDGSESDVGGFLLGVHLGITVDPFEASDDG